MLSKGKHQRTLRFVFIFVAASWLTACGFRLAGTSEMPESIDNIHLVTNSFSVQQRDSLMAVLERAGASFSEAAKAEATLIVNLKPLRQQTVVSSASSGKTLLEITQELEFRVIRNKADSSVPMKSLRQRKNFESDEDNLLSSRVQKADVIRDLELSLYNQLVFQLQRF